jgi:hypothetical protein
MSFRGNHFSLIKAIRFIDYASEVQKRTIPFDQFVAVSFDLFHPLVLKEHGCDIVREMLQSGELAAHFADKGIACQQPTKS